MYNLPNLIFYCNSEAKYAIDIRASLTKYNLPFIETDNEIDVFSFAQNPKNYIIFVANTNSTPLQLIKLSKINKNIFIVYPNEYATNVEIKHYCTHQSLDLLEKYLLANVNLNNISTKLPTSSLLNKLIMLELENLGISKKYIGFKYLVDIITNSICKNTSIPYSAEQFEYIANINSSTPDAIERDIRHMLLSSWKASKTLQITLCSKLSLKQQPNAKSVLINLIRYLKETI